MKKKSFKKSSDATEKLPKLTKSGAVDKRSSMPHLQKAGAPSINPHGRPKGSRNRFAEAFIKDFLADWEEHGADALRTCRQRDVAAYINAATKLLPKDFNINMTSEAELDKFLEQFDDTQLKELLTGLVAVGASAKKEAAAQGVGIKSDIVH